MEEADGIEIVPGPSRFFDDGALMSSPEAAPPSVGDSIAWVRRVAVYEAALAKEYRLIRMSLPDRPRPHHPVTVDGRTVDLVYDATLDRQLHGLYVGHGWPAILAVQAALERAATSYPSRKLHPWKVVKDFAEYAITALWTRVRAALAQLDRMATDELALQLNLSANLVNETWQLLGVTTSDKDEHGQEHRTPNMTASLDTVTWTKKTFYRLTEPKPLQSIMELMPRAVEMRRRLGEIKQSLVAISDTIEWGRQEASGANFPGDVSMKLSLQQLLAEADRVTAELEGVLTRIHKVTPLAILVLPFLQEPVTQLAVEQSVGEVLIQFLGEAERIVKGLPQEGSWVARMTQDERSPETQVLDLAVTGAIGDVRFLSMLSERTLDRLVEADAVPKDSFEYAVWAHYKRQLIIRLAIENKKAEFWQSIGSFLVKAATLVTLLLVRAPVGSFAARVATALNVGMMLFQCFTVAHQLAQLDQQLAQAMAEVDRRSAAEIAHVAELLASRRDFEPQLERAIVTEIGLIVVAGAWPQFREMMHMRGYYFDLQTLLEP
ncbi:hypothetical protein [Planotetraspora mira]|uniref:Uncharacterized protein n=1 Tax=Planotetraspora mira TaxID=58121 RepID=A0A8J3X9N7_9ACTN|nr:hypothetical protein [Planotetraspora mira]GII33020.1 hypothetical protein Pmi06nite_64620 [Planotetraspora mira]